MYDHVNYAREGPGAARGIKVLRGEVVDVSETDPRHADGDISVRFMGANYYQTIKFYVDNEDGNWKVGQPVEITIASFDG